MSKLALALSIAFSEAAILRTLRENPSGCSTSYLDAMRNIYSFRVVGEALPDIKQELGRLLIEKKIDYTKEGLWEPAK